MAFGQNPYYFPQGAIPDQLAAYKQAYQPMYQPQLPAQSQGNGMLWVQGEAAAKSWAVAPGASVVLWDSEAPIIYIKSADTSGIPSLRRLRWEDYPADAPQNANRTPTGDFASVCEVRALESKIALLEARLEEMAGNTTGEGVK